MTTFQSAADRADEQVATVRDDPAGRVALMAALYEGSPNRRVDHLPYRRAALAFMGWQFRRGLLNPVPSADEIPPGSPWWRAVNERLLHDTAEARAVLDGYRNEASSPSARLCIEFGRRPTVHNWYRAHNAAVIAAYLDYEQLAANENLIERFFINLVLVRVLFAHALVSAPRLALAWCAPLAPLLGDPRLGMTGIFLSLSRVLPDTYPLQGNLSNYVDAEHSFGHILDVGLIRPRIDALFAWSADELGEPRVPGLLTDGVPAYSGIDNAAVWNLPPAVPARLIRRLIPIS
ncbi:hypothetical protein [Mycolicibacterium porcinum]|uniref:hypothetical protein n=1 Tax=Mycolicibacterium porcinum TaxID=39693 RepID=UPI0008496CA9|nr:hypothetical protein [Mycolicibacterium porcinum]ODR25245.1 hypothetical protein BHQ19_13285 [Mycolicibacterium porcinum]